MILQDGLGIGQYVLLSLCLCSMGYAAAPTGQGLVGQAAAAAGGTVYVPAAKRRKTAEEKAAAADKRRQLQVSGNMSCTVVSCPVGASHWWAQARCMVSQKWLLGEQWVFEPRHMSPVAEVKLPVHLSLHSLHFLYRWPALHQNVKNYKTSPAYSH